MGLSFSSFAVHHPPPPPPPRRSVFNFFVREASPLTDSETENTNLIIENLKVFSQLLRLLQYFQVPTKSFVSSNLMERVFKFLLKSCLCIVGGEILRETLVLSSMYFSPNALLGIFLLVLGFGVFKYISSPKKPTHLHSLQELYGLLVSDNQLSVILIWSKRSKASKRVFDFLSHISQDYPDFRFATVEAEKNEEIIGRYLINSVPCTLFFKDHKIVNKFKGSNLFKLKDIISELFDVETTPLDIEIKFDGFLDLDMESVTMELPIDIPLDAAQTQPTSTEILQTEPDPEPSPALKRLLEANETVLFTDRSFEFNGFVFKDILHVYHIKFVSYDVSDNHVFKQDLVSFSGQSAFPQLFHKGRFLTNHPTDLIDIIDVLANY